MCAGRSAGNAVEAAASTGAPDAGFLRAFPQRVVQTAGRHVTLSGFSSRHT